MLEIDINDKRLDYPGFYNIYPIKREVSTQSKMDFISGYHMRKIQLDDYYGRILDNQIKFPYGCTEKMNYYLHSKSNDIVDVLRIPFRKVPIFQFESLDELSLLIKNITDENPSHEILLRGQTNLFKINRSDYENFYLYGEYNPIEPSFLPSFLRSNFKEFFMYAFWHHLTEMMLDDLKIDLAKLITKEELEEYEKDVFKIKNSPHFTFIALGFAQHYGLPSVGLDLTKDLMIAAWFASHDLKIADNGLAISNQINDFTEATIFIFSCPKDAVFSHKIIKPKFIENTRPDKQDAWFCHAGWGFAKNQLATYLICGIRVKRNILQHFSPDYFANIFPNRKEDLVLNFFLDTKNNDKYKGEVRRLLNRIYSVDN